MIWLVTFVAVLLLGVDFGLVTGIAFSIITVVIQLMRPFASLLGQLPGTELYVDNKQFEKATQLAGIIIFQFTGPLFFMNRDKFKQQLIKRSLPPKPKKKRVKMDNTWTIERNAKATV